MKSLDVFISKDRLKVLTKRFCIPCTDSHEYRVIQYALSIFNTLCTAYALNSQQKFLLYYSALFHDIGYEISPQKHDQHTLSIIRKDPIFDFLPQRERLALSLIAGGHRKKMNPKIKEFDHKDQLIIKRLTGILRVADAIDFPRDIHLLMDKPQQQDQVFLLNIQSDAFDILSTRIFKKSTLFEEAFGLTIKTMEIS